MQEASGANEDKRSRVAFERELMALWPDLRRFARSLTRNADAAEDLCQETLARALNGWCSYTNQNIMKAWLFRIARNCFLSERRKDKFKGEWDPELVERTLTSDGVIPEAEAAVDLKRLALCIENLSPDQRAAVWELGYRGLTYEEAAEKLGCPIGTIKSRMWRGRENLVWLFEHGRELPSPSEGTFQIPL